MSNHDDALTPDRIVEDPDFTTREKLDLLHELKASAMTAEDSGSDLGFSADDVDRAIEAVNRAAGSAAGFNGEMK